MFDSDQHQICKWQKQLKCNLPLPIQVSKRPAPLYLPASPGFLSHCSITLGTGSAINFFSFFTIQCNLLVALSLTFTSLSPQSKPGIFFTRLSVQSAIALYIFIVALVYNLILRGMFDLTGWHWFVDNMLHVIVPVLYILYWFYFRTSGSAPELLSRAETQRRS